MRQIIILGRGGQGAQTAGNLLAQAFYAEGLQVQTFATYGGARRGTPVTSSLRVDDKPIRARCNIENATAMLCFDESLLDKNFLRNAARGSLILVNSHQPSEAFSGLGDYQIKAVDGKATARQNGMGKVVNSALLGAFVRLIQEPNINTMCQVVEQTAPVKQAQNVAACRMAFDLLQQQL